MQDKVYEHYSSIAVAKSDDDVCNHMLATTFNDWFERVRDRFSRIVNELDDAVQSALDNGVDRQILDQAMQAAQTARTRLDSFSVLARKVVDEIAIPLNDARRVIYFPSVIAKGGRYGKSKISRFLHPKCARPPPFDGDRGISVPPGYATFHESMYSDVHAILMVLMFCLFMHSKGVVRTRSLGVLNVATFLLQQLSMISRSFRICII